MLEVLKIDGGDEHWSALSHMGIFAVSPILRHISCPSIRGTLQLLMPGDGLETDTSHTAPSTHRLTDERTSGFSMNTFDSLHLLNCVPTRRNCGPVGRKDTSQRFFRNRLASYRDSRFATAL